LNVRNERRETAKRAEHRGTHAKANVIGEERKNAADGLFDGLKDDMSRMSDDESAEPLTGRRRSPAPAKAVE
jgi:hypothetical protein